MTPEEWLGKGTYTKFNSFDIFQLQEGKGSTLVFLHGYPSSSFDWHRQVSYFASAYHCFAFDFMGFGFSSKHKHFHYTLQGQSDLTEHLLREQGIVECDLIVHDYAVSVAQELLARQTEGKLAIRLRSVVFLNGGLFPGHHKPRLIQSLLLSPIGFLINRLGSQSRFNQSFSAVFGQETQPSEQDLDDFWTILNYPNKNRLLHRLIHYMNDRIEYADRWRCALVKTTVPCLLINGNQDPVSGRHLVDAYREITERSDIVEFANLGHYPQWEDPPAVNDVLQSWLERKQ